MIPKLTTTMLLAGALCAAERFDHRVRDDFFAGFSGDAARLARGIEQCEAVLKENPQHAEALVWHGAGLFFRSKDAFQAGDRARGIELSSRGLSEMDRAAALAPDSIGVRIPRGSALLAATRFMPASPSAAGLLRQALSDYERAYELQAGHFAKLSGHSRGELLFGLAEGYLRAGDEERARQWFEKLAAMPDAGHYEQARNYLAAGKLSGSRDCVGCHVGR